MFQLAYIHSPCRFCTFCRQRPRKLLPRKFSPVLSLNLSRACSFRFNREVPYRVRGSTHVRTQARVYVRTHVRTLHTCVVCVRTLYVRVFARDSCACARAYEPHVRTHMRVHVFLLLLLLFKHEVALTLFPRKINVDKI